MSPFSGPWPRVEVAWLTRKKTEVRPSFYLKSPLQTTENLAKKFPSKKRILFEEISSADCSFAKMSML